MTKNEKEQLSAINVDIAFLEKAIKSDDPKNEILLRVMAIRDQINWLMRRG